MKITNKQLRQIIKEELQSVMNESSTILGLAALAAIRKRRAAAAKRKAAQGTPPRGAHAPYSRPNRPTLADRKREQQKAAEKAAKQAEQERYIRNIDPSLEALGQAKMKAILTLGLDEQGRLPYMYAWGNTGNENWLGTYYDGPLDYYEAMDLAKSKGAIPDDAIDDESGGFYLGNLFAGKFTPDQLPIFDQDDDDFYSDQNYQALTSGGYMDDDYSYEFTEKGNDMRKLLGL